MYEEALVYRKKALTTFTKTSIDYQTYLKAKYHHTTSASLEQKSYNYHNPDEGISKKAREQYLKEALQNAIKAKNIYSAVKKPDRMFQYQVQNRIYHQTAYLGNWKEALKNHSWDIDF